MTRADPLQGYRLVIFDADDTLRRTTAPGKPCPHRQDEWELMPGVREMLRKQPWNQSGGPFLGIASNQDQIAYGHLSYATAQALLRDLAAAAADCVPDDPALQLCPHGLETTCSCRKPEPGMLLAIMDFYGVSPNETLFVGNHEMDREAAVRAGTAFCWSQDLFGYRV
ncbi:MAG TPA: HAD-IIIA family hydrolase [Gemmatimonadales bacterium]|nr:HAD-IIIA family hydrolase [Gemmatimonadales bacterium]